MTEILQVPAQALVLAPTRELARQIQLEAHQLITASPYKGLMIHGLNHDNNVGMAQKTDDYTTWNTIIWVE